MPITIDGDALLITLPSATSVIDVETDLYSEWKKWALLADNLRFEPAFRTIAGDPLTGALEVGAYFFLRNDLGWRIRPAEEDATVNFTGNLALENSALPAIVPTLGGFTVLILGLQPVTQNADIAAQIVEGTYTMRDSMMISNAALAGLVSGVTTAQEKFRDLQDLRDRITVNFDANGNRTSLILDLT